jgi:predicted Rossmann-fold nucleotide-binding protein
VLEIESLAEFDAEAARAGSMRHWQVQDVDLRGRADVLRRFDVSGALFLGCAFTAESADDLRARGALLFPRVPEVPFDPYRAGLYTPTELYDRLDEGYEATTDGRVYAWFRRAAARRRDLRDALAMALHDHAMADALDEYVDGRPVVGVMGGHAVLRGDPTYVEAARLGRALASRGLTVATGGGPGAMEAANLGARLADEAGSTLDRVVDGAAAVPSFRPSVTAWARTALDAVEGLPDSGRSLAVPTWFYGHEPPNPFASAVAKYFANALREDVLLHLCRAGIVFLPGAAGTVQEIFQAACENYYADGTRTAPMVLVGRDHWSRVLPAFGLLESLAQDRPFGAVLHLVDSVEEAVAALGHEG